jgi:hypothetical protein
MSFVRSQYDNSYDLKNHPKLHINPIYRPHKFCLLCFPEEVHGEAESNTNPVPAL